MSGLTPHVVLDHLPEVWTPTSCPTHAPAYPLVLGWLGTRICGQQRVAADAVGGDTGGVGEVEHGGQAWQGQGVR